MVRGGVKDWSHACDWLTVVPHDAAHLGMAGMKNQIACNKRI
jgi:hypothetical protein